MNSIIVFFANVEALFMNGIVVFLLMWEKRTANYSLNLEVLTNNSPGLGM